MSLFPAFDDAAGSRPPQAAGSAQAAGTRRARRLYRRQFSWKYEGWLGDLQSGSLPGARTLFQESFRGRVPARVQRNFPDGLRRFRFLPVPHRGILEQAFRPRARALPLRLQSAGTGDRKVFPTHPRYGAQAGRENEAFLDAHVFQEMFARPLLPHQRKTALLIFEFGAFAKATFPTVDHFLFRLDDFLAGLPGGFRYGVEIRNPEYLGPGYFACLAGHGVAHVLAARGRGCRSSGPRSTGPASRPRISASCAPF